jgi:adenylate cyclase
MDAVQVKSPVLPEMAADMPSDYRRMLTREILKTELLRVKALIATATIIAVGAVILYATSPEVIQEVWRGHFRIIYVLVGYGFFIAFELIVMFSVMRQLRLDLDVPYVRRYLGAFIEMSLPSVILMGQIVLMGPQNALSYVAPTIYFLFIILSTLRLDFWLSTFTGAVAAIEVFLIVKYFPAARAAADEPMMAFGFLMARSVMLLLAGVLAGAVGMQLRRQFEQSIAAASARDRVTNLFGQHVSPQVVERLMQQGAHNVADTSDVAVMFVDIRGFTAAARARAPHDVVKRLDDAFATLVEIVDRNGGIVNKFLGDGFLALFGAPIPDPDASYDAVTAARQMLAAMEEENAKHEWPLRLGIGIHFGDVVAGNVGSPRRKEYTVIGDTVNCASRIETLNKEFGSQLLVSDSVRLALGERIGDAMALGDVEIRGYDEPMPIWRLA